MAIDAEEFGRRLQEKPLEGDRDRKRYLRVSEDLAYISVRGSLVPILPRAVDLDLTSDELVIADMHAPFWRDGRPEDGAIPPPFSLRKMQTEVKNQIDRNTCVDFASLAALEYLLKIDGEEVNLSEQYANWLFMNREGQEQCHEWLHTKRAAKYLSTYGVCMESQWGYRGREFTDCEASPNKNALKNARFGIENYKLIGGGISGPRMGNSDYLKAVLSKGKAVVTAFGMAIGEEPTDCKSYDVLNEHPGVPRVSEGGHAMLLVGYDDDCFEFKNSWGDSCDDKGYTWLTFDYVRVYARYGFIVMDVDSKKPIHADLVKQKLDLVNLRLSRLVRRAYRRPPATKVSISLPAIERTDSTAGIVFKVRKVGEGIEEIEGGVISNEKFVLPDMVEVKAGKGGVGHLVFTASDEEGRNLPGVVPFAISVSVSNEPEGHDI